MTTAEQPRAVPDERPFIIEELGEGRALARFGAYVDHPREEFAPKLKQALRTHERLACDLSDTVTLVSGWVRVLRDLSLEAKAAGKLVGIVSMGEEVRTTADILQCRDDLDQYDSVDEVWEA